jgi:hypothetical protein
MGFLSFVKNAAKTIGSNVMNGAKWIGQHVVSPVAGFVSKAAPYVSSIAGALGQPEIAAAANMAGKIANHIKKTPGLPDADMKRD